MCGICGFLLPHGERVDPEVLTAMTSSMTHRGPDDAGYVVDSPVGLGHRRLSIIDLDTGHQPIHNEDHTVQVVFNGEIYNFPELKRELVNKGHKFYTKTDTEVLVHLYEDMGKELLQRLNGMFGFAIWDKQRGALFLARDRIGVKPLYYSWDGHRLAFASELKAILTLPWIRRELDPESLQLYLAYDYVPAPRSIFKSIRKLPPAHFLWCTKGHIDEKPYWALDLADRWGRGVPEQEICDTIWSQFRRAVRRQLISDVPLGVLLSGGVDSTSVIAALREEGVGDIKTFSIGFHDPSFDESRFARLAASHFETDHHEEILEPRTMVDILPSVTRVLDEPLADASIIPTFLLSKFTRQTVKVALGGDGGDELFAGYPTYQAFRLAQIYTGIPEWLRRMLVERWAVKLPVSWDNMSFDFRVKKFISGLSYPPVVRNYVWLGTFSPREQEGLLSPHMGVEKWTDNVYGILDELLEGRTFDSLLGKLLFLDMKLYLQEGVLVKVDRASMANSLEVRVPYLDHEFVDMVTGLPEELKLRGWKTKYIFKEAVRGKLPAELVSRKKKGFGIPVAKWIAGDLRALFSEMLSQDRLRSQGIFNPTVVSHLLQEHLDRRVDNRKKLWNLFIFQLWWDNYGRGHVS